MLKGYHSVEEKLQKYTLNNIFDTLIYISFILKL